MADFVDARAGNRDVDTLIIVTIIELEVVKSAGLRADKATGTLAVTAKP